MVTMKVDSTGIDPNKSSGFEPYEGPLPRPGTYAAVIRNCRIRVSQAGNPYFNVMFEFADQQTPEKQAFKGYPLWDKIVPGESDIQKERVGKFMHAICGKVSGNVTHDEIADGGKVSKVGGKDPIGTKCKVVVTRGSYNGEPIIELRDLFAWPKDVEWPEGPADEDDSDVEVEEEEEDADTEEPEEDAEEEEEESDEVEEEEEVEEDEEDNSEFDARVAELGEMDRTNLKKTIKALDSDFKVLTKHSDEDLRNAILGLEFDLGDDEPPF